MFLAFPFPPLSIPIAVKEPNIRNPECRLGGPVIVSACESISSTILLSYEEGMGGEGKTTLKMLLRHQKIYLFIQHNIQSKLTHEK